MEATHSVSLSTPANDTLALPRLNERAVRAQVGARNYDKALVYHAWGAVHAARRSGALLEARCEGSRGETWRVRVQLDLAGLRGAKCSCPVGDDGTCKHVGATLLAWLHRTGDFVPAATLENALESLDAHSLRGLLRSLLLLHPDLESALEDLLPETLDTGRAPTSRDAWRQRVAEVFRRRGSAPDAAAEIARDVDEIAREASGWIAADDPGRAASLHEQVALALLGRHRRLGDSSEPVLALAREHITALGRCVSTLAVDHPARMGAFRALLGMVRFDLDGGSNGSGPSAGRLAVRTVSSVATPSERVALARMVSEVMGRADDWARRTWAGVKLELERGVLDDASWLAAARALGRRDLCARELAVRGEVQEALAEFEHVPAAELLEVAEAFVASGFGSEVEKALAARSARCSEVVRVRIGQWLGSRVDARRDALAGTEVDEAMFRAAPTRETWEALATKATLHGTWGELREGLLAYLAERGIPLCVDLHLAEGELDEAIRAASEGHTASFLAPRQRVIDRVEAERPGKALALLELQVDALIAQGGRGSYRDAARALARVRGLRERMGEGKAFEATLAGLRIRHSRRTALIEELSLHFGSPT